MILIHETLENILRTNFELMQHHHFRLDELDNMQPWEREIYIILLNQYIQEKEQQANNG